MQCPSGEQPASGVVSEAKSSGAPAKRGFAHPTLRNVWVESHGWQGRPKLSGERLAPRTECSVGSSIIQSLSLPQLPERLPITSSEGTVSSIPISQELDTSPSFMINGQRYIVAMSATGPQLQLKPSQSLSLVPIQHVK